MKSKTPKLTPAQKAQILGEQPASAHPLEEMDLRAFLRIARKMYCRECPPAPALALQTANCIHCNRANVIIGLSRALDYLEGDLQTLNHQIKPVILAARLLLKASRTIVRNQSRRQ